MLDDFWLGTVARASILRVGRRRFAARILPWPSLPGCSRHDDQAAPTTSPREFYRVCRCFRRLRCSGSSLCSWSASTSKGGERAAAIHHWVVRGDISGVVGIAPFIQSASELNKVRRKGMTVK